MTVRTSRKTVTFGNPFSLAGVDRVLPAGKYEVVTDEELIEGPSFPVYRRVATMMTVPTPSLSVELFSVDPFDLVAACRRDATITEAGAARAKVP